MPSLEAYSLWAETYDRIPNPVLALEERIVAPLLPALERMVALDIACGTGRWLDRMLQRGAAFGAGFDLSGEMLEQARRKPGLRGRLARGDCEAIPLGCGTADLAMCSFLVGYVSNLPQLARELSRIMRERGHLFLSDFHPSARQRGWKRTFRHKETIIEISSSHYSIDEICLALTLEGFELVNRIEPCFGEAERHIFEACGREHLPDESLGPAIFVCHFRKSGKLT